VDTRGEEEVDHMLTYLQASGSFRFAMFGWDSDRKASMNVRLERLENVAHSF
jgi:hypothetical protein